MNFCQRILKVFVTSVFAGTTIVSMAFADSDRLDELYAELQQPELPNWEEVESKIWREWSRSGSASMDLLLQRGRKALKAGDTTRAIEHLTALIDHAPDFAEGWNARATAFFTAEEFGLSISDIQHTLALNPRHFGAWQGLGRILEELEREEEALEAYRAAAAIHPHRDGLKEAIERLEKEVSGQDV